MPSNYDPDAYELVTVAPKSPIETMPIISMYGPWANWVGLEWKSIETRKHARFKGLVGKRIGIHCSLKWDKQAIETARPYLSVAQITATQHFLRIGGAVSWTALVTEGRWLTPDDESKTLIECATRRFGIFLSDVRTIETVPMRGHRGIWYAPLPIGEPRWR